MAENPKSSWKLTVRCPDNVDAVRDSVGRSPKTSIGIRSQELGLSCTSLQIILKKDNRQYPCRNQMKHKLKPVDMGFLVSVINHYHINVFHLFWDTNHNTFSCFKFWVILSSWSVNLPKLKRPFCSTIFLIVEVGGKKRWIHNFLKRISATGNANSLVQNFYLICRDHFVWLYNFVSSTAMIIFKHLYKAPSPLIIFQGNFSPNPKLLRNSTVKL